MNHVYCVWKTGIRSQMVNKWLYQEVLARLRGAVCRKRHELWENQTWRLHHDNAPDHASLLICSYLAKHQTSIVPHPPYFPGLAPADFFSFPNWKPLWKDVVSKPKIQKNATREPRAITESALQEAFQKRKKRWERRIGSRGDCCEGDSA